MTLKKKLQSIFETESVVTKLQCKPKAFFSFLIVGEICQITVKKIIVYVHSLKPLSISSKSIDSNMEAAINMWSFTEKVVKSESLKKS